MTLALFRVDASTNMGTGHVYRCLTLAEGLRAAGYRCHFVCRAHQGHLGALIKRKGFGLSLLPLSAVESLCSERQPYQQWIGAYWQQDAEQTLTVLEQLEIDQLELLVVDHYGLDARWQNRMRTHCHKIFVLDDLADRLLDADWLLDQTYARTYRDYQSKLTNPRGCILVGAQYALLRPEFAQERTQALVRRSQPIDVPNLLITLGGADPENHSALLLQCLAEAFPNASIKVVLVIGASNPHITELETLISSLTLDVVLHVATSDMAQLMAQADLAIGAAGTTTWERCVLGLPTLTLCLADNQRDVLANLSKSGAIIPLDIDVLSSPLELKASIEHVLLQRHQIIKAAASITDGLGLQRILMAICFESIRDGQHLQLRFGTEDDCNLLFQWQCSPQTRRFARNANPPTWPEHKEWYQKKLADANSVLTFMVIGENPVGMLRLDPIPDTKCYEISILVAPEYYRLGIAEAGLNLLRRIYPDYHFLATVLEGNEASHRLFQRLGYESISSEKYQLLPLESIL